MVFRFLALAGCSLAFTFSSLTQTPGRLELSPDQVLMPAPRQPLSEWVAAEGRTPVSLPLDNGAILRGFRYSATKPDAPELLFFNGLGMTVLRSERAYRAIAATGVNVTVYDYRGWGFSSGESTSERMRSDSLLTFDAVRKSSGTRPLLVFGTSLGTAIASYVASQRPVSALVLGMPIASAAEEFPVFGRLVGLNEQVLNSTTPSAESRAFFDEPGMVAKSQAPLLVLSGTADRVVPPEQNREVFNASTAPDKHFVSIPGAAHNQVILMPEALAALKELAARVH